MKDKVINTVITPCILSPLVLFDLHPYLLLFLSPFRRNRAIPQQWGLSNLPALTLDTMATWCSTDKQVPINVREIGAWRENHWGKGVFECVIKVFVWFLLCPSVCMHTWWIAQTTAATPLSLSAITLSFLITQVERQWGRRPRASFWF